MGRVPRIRCKDLVFWVFDLVFITCIVLETRKVFKQNTQGFGKLRDASPAPRETCFSLPASPSPANAEHRASGSATPPNPSRRDASGSQSADITIGNMQPTSFCERLFAFRKHRLSPIRRNGIARHAAYVVFFTKRRRLHITYGKGSLRRAPQSQSASDPNGVAKRLTAASSTPETADAAQKTAASILAAASAQCSAIKADEALSEERARTEREGRSTKGPLAKDDTPSRHPESCSRRTRRQASSEPAPCRCRPLRFRTRGSSHAV